MKETPMEFNHLGWFAIQHEDGWWLGSEKGVPCYRDMDHARIALTVVWARENQGRLRFQIKPFTGANKITGEHTPALSYKEAMKRYMGDLNEA